MNRLRFVLPAVVLCLSLTGCSKTDEAESYNVGLVEKDFRAMTGGKQAEACGHYLRGEAEDVNAMFPAAYYFPYLAAFLRKVC